jgi:nucleotide-binding universal stress UspA family protein
MTESLRPNVRPDRILLATDLSSRGDRAFDRAVQLAREWQAELHVVHAIEGGRPMVPAGVDAETYLRNVPDHGSNELAELKRLCGDTIARLHVEDGPATEVVLSVAEREGCGLLVLGETRDRLLGPLEGTLDTLMRTSAVSVLAVRSRPAGPYRALMVGTDLTDEARQALVSAAMLFPQADIRLVHALGVSYAGLLDAGAADQDASGEALRALRAHLEGADLPPERRNSIHVHVEAGPASAVLRRSVIETGVDLTVIGAHRRGMVYDTVLGRSRHIVEAVPGDILVVRAVRRDAG